MASSSSASDGIIPGLISALYTAGTRHTVSAPPSLTSCTRSPSGEFSLQWNAPGSNGSSYCLQAQGRCSSSSSTTTTTATATLLTHVSCSCPSFNKLQKPNGGVWVVCKHLLAALDRSVDPAAAAVQDNHNNKNSDTKKRARSTATTKFTNPYASSSSTTRSSPSHAPAIKKKRTMVPMQPPKTGCAQPAPIYLLATQSDRELRTTTQPSTHWSHTQTRTLRELLQIGESVSLQWCVVANFMIDFNFLLNEFPEIVSIPTLAVMYSPQNSSSPHDWKTAFGGSSDNNNSGRQTMDLVPLSPSDPPKSTNNPLRVKIPYGVHHTKLFLVGYGGNGCLRVIIHTANLVEGDQFRKTQAVYYEDFPLKATNTGDTTTCEYEETLCTYLSSYGYHAKRSWNGNNLETLVEAVRRYDFRTARAVLVPSIPGYHKLSSLEKLGHLKVRQAVATHTQPCGVSRPIVCQFSSIGSLTAKYLQELELSMDSDRAGERTLSVPKSASSKLQLVYPTAAEIRDSIEGYAGGGSVPGRLSNTTKPFLQNLFYRWRSSRSNGNPIFKPRNVPHIKTYFQLDQYLNGLEWMVVSSHNVSKAAWGEVQNGKFGQQFFIRHWELGVFVSPQTLGVNKIRPWTPASSAPQPGVATVPLPYAMHPDPYQSSDEAWACDGDYREPDQFGISWCKGPVPAALRGMLPPKR